MKYAQVPSVLSGFYDSDGDYTAELKSRFTYEGAEEESVIFKFYIDTELPEIISYGERYDEETGKTFLDVTARDNRYLMGVVVQEFPDEGELKQAPFEPQENAGEERTVSIDITGFDEYTFTVYDYALNRAAVSDSRKIIIAPFGGVNVGINNIDLSVNTTNLSGEDITADIIAVLCDEDGNLIEVNVNKGADMPNGDSTNTFRFKKPYNPDYTVMFFVWDSVGGMKPLCGKSEYSIEDWK